MVGAELLLLACLICARQIAVSDPENLAALVAQARKAFADNQLDIAVECHRRAVALSPDDFNLNFDLAVALHASGRHNEAAAHFSRATSLDPTHYQAHLNQGLTEHQIGRSAQAISTLSRAAALGGADIQAHLSLAAILRTAGRNAEAQEWLQQALTIQPRSPAALLAMGQLLSDSRSFQAAAKYFAQVTELEPQNLAASLQLVVGLLNLARPDEALSELTRIQQFHPDDPQLRTMALAAYRESGDAVAALECAREILLTNPGDLDALKEVHKGSADQAEQERARAAMYAFCRREPANIAGWKALAEARANEGYESVIDVLEEGIARTDDPALRLTRVLTFPRVPKSVEQIRAVREGMERHLDHILNSGERYRISNLIKSVNKTAFRLAYHGLNDRGMHEKISKAHLAVAPDLAWTSPHIGRKNARKRIRIGFVSAFFRWHSLGRMMASLIRDLDRSLFEVIVVRPTLETDDYGRDIDRSADGVVTVPFNIPVARAAISEADLDILFFPDIGMEAFSYYLSFSRLARRQVVWPGHPVTTGQTTFDAFISGASAEPADCQSHYSEKLVRFSQMPIYEKSREVESDYDLRSEFDLPKGPLYVCPIVVHKFHPDIDAIFRKILDRDPHGSLVIVHPGYGPSDPLYQRFSESIPDISRRLHVLPWLKKQQYYGLLRVTDAMLDTVHFTASSTSRDAASVGTPIVTLESRFMRGRQAAAMYRDMGLPELVMPSEDAYVDFAVRMANDQAFRSRIKRDVKDASASFVLNRQVLREFEQFFIDVLGTG